MWILLKMSHSFHIVFNKNRHSLQQSQRNASAQRSSFGEIDEILQTETQRDSRREFYRDIIRRVFRVIIRFQGNLSISNISLTRELDAVLWDFDCDGLWESNQITTNPLKFRWRQSHCSIILGLPSARSCQRGGEVRYIRDSHMFAVNVHEFYIVFAHSFLLWRFEY